MAFSAKTPYQEYAGFAETGNTEDLSTLGVLKEESVSGSARAEPYYAKTGNAERISFEELSDAGKRKSGGPKNMPSSSGFSFI